MPDVANTVLFGLSNAHFAFKTTDYGTPVAAPGSVSLSLTPRGDATTFYADNGPYYELTSNNGYEGSLEIAQVTDSLMVSFFGWEIDANGALIEIADAQPAEFALLFEVEGDTQSRRTVLYGCKASRPKIEHKTTEEGREVTTVTFEFTSKPIVLDEKKVAKATLPKTTASATMFEAFFLTVYEPGQAAA